jgi:hypothetical protein
MSTIRKALLIVVSTFALFSAVLALLSLLLWAGSYTRWGSYLGICSLRLAVNPVVGLIAPSREVKWDSPVHPGDNTIAFDTQPWYDASAKESHWLMLGRGRLGHSVVRPGFVYAAPLADQRFELLGFIRSNTWLTGGYSGTGVQFSLVLPLWLPTVLFGIGPAAWAMLYWRPLLQRRRRSRRGLCLSCGYDLRGNTTGVCSECGSEVSDGCARRGRLQAESPGLV